MSSMKEQEGRGKRPRRAFTEEFKGGAVRLVLDEGKTIAQVARDLDLSANSVATWVSQAGRTGRKARPASPPRSVPCSRGCARKTASCGWSAKS